MKKFDGALFDPSKWGVFFEDNFSTSTYSDVSDLDAVFVPGTMPGTGQWEEGKWIRTAPFDLDGGWGAEQFLPSKVSLETPSVGSDKFVRLTATRVPQNTLPNGRTIHFESGLIRVAPLPYLDRNSYVNVTNPDSEFYTGFTYGAFEVRVRLPLANVAGVWPVIWLYSGQIEIDFLDNLKPQPAEVIQGGAIMWEDEPWNRVNPPFDYWTDQGPASGSTAANYEFDKYYYEGDEVVHKGILYKANRFIRRAAFGNICPKTEGDRNLAEEFNTYTVVWTPTEITFFLNGYKIYSNTKEYMSQKVGTPFFIIGLQMAEWAKNAMSNIGDSTYMDIASVRVYKPIGYTPPPAPFTQIPALYNFRFHDKTTIFNNLASLNSTFPKGVYIEQAESDLILWHNGDKLYFRSKFNRLSNFYFDVPDLNNPSPKKWNFNCLNWNIINVIDNVVHHPTEDRLFYRGKNPTNGHSVWSFYFESGIWKNQNLSSTGLDNVAGDIVVSPDGKQVYYRSKNDRICYFEKVGMAWQHFDTVPTIYNVRGNVVHSLTQSKRIYYQGFDNRLYNFYIDNGVWKNGHLGNVGDPNIPTLNALENVNGYIIHSPDEEKLYYKGIDNKIYLFHFEAGWKRYCLSDITGAGVLAEGYLVHGPSNPNNPKVYYIGMDHKLYNFYIDGGWKHSVLSPTTDNVAFSKYCVSDNGNKIFYKGLDNRLHLFYFIAGVGSLNGRWYARSLKHEGGDNVAGNIVISPNDKPFYIGTDGQVWNYFEKWSGNYDLTDEEISLD